MMFIVLLLDFVYVQRAQTTCGGEPEDSCQKDDEMTSREGCTPVYWDLAASLHVTYFRTQV